MKISTIIPCYNQSEYLESACDSILAQKHSDWEVLIINDGSTDLTEKIAKEICNKDDRFKYFYKKNGGLSSARNYGLDRVNGDYIQFLDCDDIIVPDKFSESLELKSDLIITNFEMLKEKITPPFCKLEGQVFSFENILMDWDIKYSIPIHCGLFSSKLIKGIRFNEDLKAKEDWVFWLDYFKKKPIVTFINKPMAIYRLHNSSMTQDKIHMLENWKKVYELLYDKFDTKYQSLLFKKITNEITNERYRLYNVTNDLNKVTSDLNIMNSNLNSFEKYLINEKKISKKNHNRYLSQKKKKKKVIIIFSITTLIFLLLFLKNL